MDMASLESIGQRILTQRDGWAKVLLGGLLCLTVIGAPFALGYLFRYAYRLRNSGDLALPAWEDWGRHYLMGLMFLGVWLIWFLLPLLLGAVLSLLLGVITFGITGIVAWLPFSITLLMAPALFCAALMRFQKHRNWGALLEYKAIWAPLGKNPRLVPSGGVCFAGILALGLPLLPFAFFLGFLILIPYYMFNFTADSRVK